MAVQVAIDCADPHLLAGFWAVATGMEVEDHHDAVAQVLAAGHPVEDEVLVREDGRRAWRTAAAGNELCVA